MAAFLSPITAKYSDFLRSASLSSDSPRFSKYFRSYPSVLGIFQEHKLTTCLMRYQVLSEFTKFLGS